jgi:hypothetical protein
LLKKDKKLTIIMSPPSQSLISPNLNESVYMLFPIWVTGYLTAENLGQLNNNDDDGGDGNGDDSDADRRVSSIRELLMNRLNYYLPHLNSTMLDDDDDDDDDDNKKGMGKYNATPTSCVNANSDYVLATEHDFDGDADVINESHHETVAEDASNDSETVEVESPRHHHPHQHRLRVYTVVISTDYAVDVESVHNNALISHTNNRGDDEGDDINSSGVSKVLAERERNHSLLLNVQSNIIMNHDDDDDDENDNDNDNNDECDDDDNDEDDGDNKQESRQCLLTFNDDRVVAIAEDQVKSWRISDISQQLHIPFSIIASQYRSKVSQPASKFGENTQFAARRRSIRLIDIPAAMNNTNYHHHHHHDNNNNNNDNNNNNNNNNNNMLT